jgi:hypothetical protein
MTWLSNNQQELVIVLAAFSKSSLKSLEETFQKLTNKDLQFEVKENDLKFCILIHFIFADILILS